MHKKGRIALAMTAAAATVLIAGGVYAASVDATSVGTQSLSSDALKQVLVPDAQQPAYSSINAPITIMEADSANLFEPEPGLTSSPSNCLRLSDAIGDLSSMVGWLQTGERDTSVAPSSSFLGFSQGVFEVPGGASAAIDRVASILRGCGAATITIDLGGTVQHGTTGFAEHAGAYLPGARTYASTQVTTFGPTGALAVATSTATSPAEPEVCTVEIGLIAQGDTLIWLQEPTPELLSVMVNTTYQRLQAVNGTPTPTWQPTSTFTQPASPTTTLN